MSTHPRSTANSLCQYSNLLPAVFLFLSPVSSSLDVLLSLLLASLRSASSPLKRINDVIMATIRDITAVAWVSERGKTDIYTNLDWQT